MHDIKLVLFDFDGTLANSHDPLIIPSYEYICERYGLDKTKLTDPKFGNCTIVQAYEHLGVQAEHFDIILEEHKRFQKENIHLLKEMEGAARALELLSSSKFHIAVITNRRDNGPELLQHCKHLEYIDLVVGAEEVKHGKPDPEGIIMALEHFGVNPENAVMIGDSHVDIEAGKRAGTKTVFFNTRNCGDNDTKVKALRPDYTVTSYSELLALFHGQMGI